jgi:hypothetical protein
MKSRKQPENKVNATKIYKEWCKCKPKELENLPKQDEIIIQKSKNNNNDLLMAKTIITSRLTSMINKNKSF